MEDFPDVDAYLAASRLWPAEIAALRPILLDCGLEEHIKWGKPCYAHDGANVAIVQEFSDFLALMFFKGVLLDDPADLLEDQGPNTHAAMRMTFRSATEVEERSQVLRAYLAEAIEKIDMPLPPRPQEELAEELQDRLASDPKLAAAFDKLTPGRQRAYNLHVSDAKQATTRQRRVDKIAPRILEGKGLHDR